MGPHVWTFSPVPDHELLKAWNSLSDTAYRDIFCSSKIALGSLYIASGYKLVTRKIKPCLEAWTFQPHLQHPEKRDWSLSMSPLASDLINLIYAVGTLLKHKWWGSESFPAGNRIHELGGCHPSRLHGTEAPALGTILDIILCTTASGCWFVSFIIN